MTCVLQINFRPLPGILSCVLRAENQAVLWATRLHQIRYDKVRIRAGILLPAPKNLWSTRYGRNMTWLDCNFNLLNPINLQVFIILKKNNRQLTFLHIYHHSGMIFASFLGMFFVPNGTSAWVPLVNVFVHAIMYAYYLLSIIKPEYKKSIKMKKTLTQIQMVIEKFTKSVVESFLIDVFFFNFLRSRFNSPFLVQYTWDLQLCETVAILRLLQQHSELNVLACSWCSMISTEKLTWPQSWRVYEKNGITLILKNKIKHFSNRNLSLI